MLDSGDGLVGRDDASGCRHRPIRGPEHHDVLTHQGQCRRERQRRRCLGPSYEEQCEVRFTIQGGHLDTELATTDVYEDLLAIPNDVGRGHDLPSPDDDTGPNVHPRSHRDHGLSRATDGISSATARAGHEKAEHNTKGDGAHRRTGVEPEPACFER